MSGTVDDIRKHVIAKTTEVWSTSQQPYLISHISPELRAKGIEYKDIIAPQTLKQFLGTVGEVRIVQHPLHKPKIGLVPHGVAFEYEEDATVSRSTESTTPKRPRQPSSGYIVIQFLDALSKLDKEDLDKVNIPVSVLAQIVGRK